MNCRRQEGFTPLINAHIRDRGCNAYLVNSHVVRSVRFGGEWKLKPGTYWCDIGGYKFCKDSVIMRDGIYLGTKRLAKKMYKKGYYTLHECQSINSRIGWAKHCNSNNFIKNDIQPYVDINQTRKVVSVCGANQVTAKR